MVKPASIDDVLDALEEFHNQATYTQLATWALAQSLEIDSLQPALDKCLEAGEILRSGDVFVRAREITWEQLGAIEGGEESIEKLRSLATANGFSPSSFDRLWSTSPGRDVARFLKGKAAQRSRKLRSTEAE